MPKVKILIVDSEGDLLSQFWLSPQEDDDRTSHLTSDVRLSNDIETVLSLRYEFEEIEE